MRKFYSQIIIVIALLINQSSNAQDFSNKGKDFWVGYGYHIRMGVANPPGGSQDMFLYFVTDSASDVTVSCPGTGWSVTYNIPANTVFTTGAIPKFTPDHRLTTEGTSNKGIHIVSTKPIVAYAHIFNSAVSGATILYPTNTLGKEYYSVNYKQYSNDPNSYPWFYIIAADTGITRVEITPSANTSGGWLAGNTYTITLTQGQVYNVMGQLLVNTGAGPYTAVDLTGSKIRSVSIGNSGCKKIAVFSGSGKIHINCSGTPNTSADNYMVQAMPKASWGKTYLTVPTATYGNAGSSNPTNNIYRVCVDDPTTIVNLNGSPIPYPLQNNFYYEIPPTNVPQLITANKSIMVAQYLPSQGGSNCNVGNGDGDPEVIYLSSVEQNISKVRWNACQRFCINGAKHYINVVIPNTGTAISTFRLDGVPVPPSSFNVHPFNNAYSYAILNVSGITGITGGACNTYTGPYGVSHLIESDSGFNAIAYGYGAPESYGYNAGTNVRDLTQGMVLETQYGIDSFSSICTFSPFRFKLYYPDSSLQTPPVAYRFDSIRWDLSNRSMIVPNNFPITQVNPTIDSTNIRNGRIVNWYSIPGFYFFNAPGIDTLLFTAYRSSNEGCGTEQLYEFPILITNPPPGDFTWTTNGCFTQPVQFIETTNQAPRPTYRFWWDFGDPASGPANNSTLRNPTHLFSGPGTYSVRYSAITTPGCILDTVTKIITLDNPPVADFAAATPYCINVPIQFTDMSTASPGDTINAWSWTFGDGGTSTLQNPSHTYLTAGTFWVTLQVQTTIGCPSAIDSMQIVIAPDGTITLTSAPGTDNQTVCINTPITNITYAVGGSSNGGSVSGLPAGVTGSYAGGIITISGTPTVSGVFNYTVTTIGPCVNPTANGTITVTEDGTITLTSPPGTDTQTVCINTPIVPITYAVGGSGTGGSVSGLPAGVTGTFAGGVITITGTPTVSGVFNYTVNTTGPCVNPSATGMITVTADGTITLTSAPGTDNQTVCINTPIVNITYAVGASGTGGSVSGLPAGVTGSFAGGIITISGTPTVSGVFNYTVSTTGPCVNPTATGTITVTEDGTITLTSAPGTDNQTVCINTPIINITYAVGGSGNGGSVTGLPAGVTGSFAGGVITISGTPTVSGVFNYTVNTTGPCVNPSATGTITVTPDGTITLTSAPGTDNQTVCINTPIINITYAVGASGNGGSVSGLPAGVTGSYAGGVITITGTPTVSGVFNYTVTTTGPCVNPTATGTITVTEDGTITLTSAPGTDNQAVCLNTPIINITYAVGGSGTGGSVVGLPAGITGTFAGGVITISGTPTVSGTFIYTVNTTGPCVTPSATGTILVRPLPTANFNYTIPSCETRTICFTDLSVANAGTVTGWAWDFGDGGTSTLQNPCHTFATAGTYNVTLVVTTNFGCVSITPAQQVVINARPQAGFIVPDVCLSDTYAQFTDTSKLANGVIDRWDWNFGDPGSGPLNTSNLQNPTHSYSATGNYPVRLIVWNSVIGCRDTITQTLTVNGSFPVAIFNVPNPTTLCANDSVAIIEASTVFPGNITKIEIWFDNVAAGPPGPPDILDDYPFTGKVYKHLYPNFQTPLTRVFTIRYRAYSGGVCVDDTLRNITVNAAPLVQFNSMPNICYDAAPYQIPPAIASEIGGVPGSGVFTGPGVSLTGLFSPAVAGPGTHRILYTFTSATGGCVDTASNTITVWDTATARINVQPLICEGTAISFSSTNSTIPAGNGTITGWSWNFGDPGSGAANTSSLQNPTHIFTGWGNFNVTLTVISSNGCRSTVSSLTVFVNPEPKPNFSTPVSSCLPNASVAFTNLTTIADGSPLNYSWNFGDPGNPNNTSTQISPSHVYTSTGPFNVYLQATSAAGCVNDTTIALTTVHPQPLASFTTDKIDVCIGSGIQFTNTSNPMDGTITQYNWTMDDGNVRNIPVFNYTYSAVGTYTVSLFIINSHGCRSTTATKTVFVNPYPPVNAGPDKFMLEGGQVMLTPALNANMPVTYLWSPNFHLSDPTIPYTIARPPYDFTYTLTVTTDKGCARSDDVFIKVLKAPAIPNIFSPNGDGIHDTWVIEYLESYPGATVDIFNRYGQKIYHSDGYSKPWDGTINGNPVPIGTYYYIVNPKNGRKIMSGYVDVIR